MLDKITRYLFQPFNYLVVFFVAVSIVYLWRAEATKPTDFMDVSLDIVEYSDKITVEYSREIKRDFLGIWVVEVNRISEPKKTVCNGKGINSYNVNEKQNKELVLDVFVGDPKCKNLEDGLYQMTATWQMTDKKNLTKVLILTHKFQIGVSK